MADHLYQEICRNPADDTLRLAYADWLDEHGDHDRAEFVRVQYELEGMPEYRGIRVGLDWTDPEFSPKCKRAVWLRRREEKILFAGPNWADCSCEACGGGGIIGQGRQCPTCHGTGDLFLAPGVSGVSPTPPPKPRTVTFARGFPDAVSCTLAEAFAGSDGTPTPWASEVVRRTPVTRFVLSYPLNYRGSAHYGAFGGRPAWDWSSANVPEFLMLAMAEAFPDNATGRGDTKVQGRPAVWWVEFGTEAEARDALALAAGRPVRRHVYGEVTQ